MILLASCARPRDPLDWKVSANTPADYTEWVATVSPKLPPDLVREYNELWYEYVIVSGRAGVARNPNDANDPVCRELNGRSLRMVLVRGYELKKARLDRKIASDTELLLHDIQSSGDAKTDDAERRWTTRIDLRKREIDDLKQEIVTIDRRLADLLRRAPR